MPINSIRDNENNRWNKNAKKRPEQQKNKQSRKRKRMGGGGEGDRNCSEKMRAKWFCCAKCTVSFSTINM